MRGIRYDVEEVRAGQHCLEEQTHKIGSNLQLSLTMAFLLEPKSVRLLDKSPCGSCLATSADRSVDGPNDRRYGSQSMFSLQRPPLYRSRCPCNCHRRRVLKSPTCLSSLIGYSFVKTGISLLCMPQSCDCAACHRLSCHKRRPSTIQISYYFPTWLVARMVQLQFNGPRISLSSIQCYLVRCAYLRLRLRWGQ